MQLIKVLIFYDYFDPAYKAGGPIRSLYNLVGLLRNEMSFYVITGDKDHDAGALPITPDEWTNHVSGARVIYLSQKKRSYQIIKRLTEDVQPDYFYINGVFSKFSFILPLIIGNLKKIKTVVAPRGMLQQGALSQKGLKKKIYLFVTKPLFNKKIRWQLTTEEEFEDFIRLYPDYANSISIIGNVPTLTPTNTSLIKNDRIKITIGTIALIGPMKNHRLILESLQNIKYNVHYHIYGPILDEKYWAICQKLISTLPDNIVVEYKGELPPNKVAKAISTFHYYIQPSKSENFGHSIFEALSMGIPVITSEYTPWNSLHEKRAGWNVSIANSDHLLDIMNAAFNQSVEEHKEFSKGARFLAKEYVENLNLKDKYITLFSK